MSPDEIKALRKDLGCTAKELAVALGIEQANVLAWERAEAFPTKQYVDRMIALHAAGPGAIPRRASRRARPEPPMKILSEPGLWTMVRKIIVHAALREEVARLAEDYTDPADDG